MASNVDDIDVGVLEGAADAAASNNVEDVSNKSASSRWSVYKALENAKFIGSPCMAGKADGTMPIP